MELTIGTNTSRIFSVAEMSGVLSFLVSNTGTCTLQELVRRSRNRRSPWLSTESSVSCWEAEISSAPSINRPHQHHRDTQLLGTFSHELRPRLSWTPVVATAVRTRAELCYDWSCWRFLTCCRQTLHDHCMGRRCGIPHKRVFETVEGDAHRVQVPNR